MFRSSLSQLAQLSRPPVRLGMIAVLLALFAVGCSNYDFTFNEQPVGPTPKLAEKIDVDDAELSECIDRMVYDQRISHLNQLTRLSCPRGEIRSLSGIAQLQQLTYVNLAQNQLHDVAALTSLTQLIEADLRGNKQLDCKGVRQLEARGVRVKAPQHCR